MFIVAVTHPGMSTRATSMGSVRTRPPSVGPASENAVEPERWPQVYFGCLKQCPVQDDSGH
jgi:hypothetical protein